MPVKLVRFDILTPRGEEMLDEAEAKSGTLPYLRGPDHRNYAIERIGDFMAVLGAVDPDWPRHLKRTLLDVGRLV